MQRGVAKGLKVPCLFMITEVSICCKKIPEVGIRRIPAYTPQYTTAYGPAMPLPLTVSCFSKIQIGFTFLIPAHPGSPGQ